MGAGGITHERWKALAQTFDAVVDQSPAERARTLADLDDTLRAEVEELLARADTQDRVPKIVARAMGRMRRPTTPMVGRRIGPYQIERELGHGGMGAVYLATRTDDFQSRVAIKLLHRGLETEQAVARFRDERQILAALDHPNIVRLIDGGATTEGLPYLVMEHVEGVPITVYAKQHELSVRERVELFRAVCAGIHYAHSKLIVHRDLKPSNILVAANGVPKLLDFGIAKLLDATGPRREAHTGTGMLLLTPEYASPEQARAESVSTASDVYSLGAVLYELLCGVPPHRSEGNGLEILHRILEEAPVVPSIAAPGDRKREIQGDLDNVVLKALDKEQARRYASADHLSEDLRRYLDGLPVEARAATWSYRTGKFIRRNRLAVVSVALIATALTVATVVSIEQARRAEAETQRAERETEIAQRRFADVRALASTLFDIDDRISDLAGTTATRELIVGRAAEYLDKLSRDADTDVTLQRDVAAGYLKVAEIQGSDVTPSLGRPEDARRSYAKARAIIDRIGAQHDPINRKLRAEWLIGDGKLSAMADAPRAQQSLAEALTLVSTLPDEVDRHRLTTLAQVGLFNIANNQNDAPSVTRSAKAMLDSASQWNRIESSPDARYYEGIGREAIAASLNTAGDADGAVVMADRARLMFSDLATEHSNRLSYRREYINMLVNTAGFRAGTMPGALWMPGTHDLPEADRLVREGIQLYVRLVERDPDNSRARLDLLLAQLSGGLLIADPAEGLASFEAARKTLREMPTSSREWPVVEAAHAFLDCAIAAPLAVAGRTREARAAISEGQTRAATSKVPYLGEQCDFAIAHAYEALGERATTITTLDSLASKLRTAVAKEPESSLVRIGLVDTLLWKVRLGVQCEESIAEARQVWKGWPGTSTSYLERRRRELDAIRCEKLR